MRQKAQPAPPRRIDRGAAGRADGGMRRPALLPRLRAALRRLPVLIALAAMAAVPRGAMPVQLSEGALVMVLCTGEGPLRVVADPATGEVRPLPAGDRGTATAACAWCLAQAAFDLPAPAVVPATAAPAGRTAPAERATARRPAHDPRSPWPRGPPLPA